MVNEREKQILEQYEKQGWKTIRCGSPDFLFLKTNNGDIKDFIFVEVKSYNSNLSYEQFIWKKILEKLGAKYRIEVIK
jgi:predicted Holliday junction resolvase-like endonuclease